MKDKIKLQATDGRLANGILLNGVWRDYYDIIVSANELERYSEDRIGFLTEDRDSLAMERTILLEQWRINISSLTGIETNQLEATQIIDQIRIEKSNLEGRCSSLEAQRDWLDKQRRELSKELAAMSDSMDFITAKLKREENELRIEKIENKCLQELTYRRDEMIEFLQTRISKSDEEIEVLAKSISAKDRQFQAILKERNRLKDELEVSRKETARGRRFPNSSQSFKASQTPLAGRPPMLLRSDFLVEERPSKLLASPDHGTDDDTQTLKSDVRSSPLSGSSTSVDKENVCDGFRECLERNPLFSDCDLQHSTIADGNISVVLPDNEPSFDVRDRIYRSVIKKLQNELKVVRNQALEIASTKSKFYRSGNK